MEVKILEVEEVVEEEEVEEVKGGMDGAEVERST